MTRLFFVLCFIIAPALAAVPSVAGPDDAFQVTRLTPADSRFLQAALSLSGHYNGLIDGRWGRGSERALLAVTGPRPTNGEVIGALSPIIAEADSSWVAFNTDSLSFLAPSALFFREDATSDPFISYATPSRDLVLRIFFGAASNASDMHSWLEANAVSEFYRADTPTAFVTKARLGDGDTVYLWTTEDDSDFVTALVQWSPRQAHRARLMVASLSTGYVPELRITQGGYLAEIVSELSSTPSEAPINPPVRQVPPAATGSVGTGTGFFVSATTIVTAAHVVEGCGTLRLADDTPVAMLATDRSNDLAVAFLVGQESSSWLPLSDEIPRLGAPVIAIGFPYSGIFAQGVSATSGNVSALRGLSGSPNELLLSAPVQPGNSGGPLLDRSGRVLGVVTARASEAYVRERSGSTPQNMNVATQLVPLRALLSDAGVVLPSSDDVLINPDAFESGLPEAVVAAVVQLRCLP